MFQCRLFFGFSLYLFGGCRQFRVALYPLGRPADGRTVYIKPAGQLILFDAKIKARSGDDRGQIDTGRLHQHSAPIDITGVLRGSFDEFTDS